MSNASLIKEREATSQLDLGLKKDFPIFSTHPNLTYLDTASTAQKPEIVIDAESNFYREKNANIHRGLYDLGIAATDAYENARRVVANFISAEPNEIVFTNNATSALNMATAIESQRLNKGDEILLSIAEHHSNILPWQKIARETGARLVWVGLAPEGQLDLHDFSKKLSSRTAVVAITHVSNVLGSIMPLQEIIEAAHKVGARVVVDAAQSVGRVPFSVKEIESDYIAFTGHKAYGPTGIGVLHGKAEILEQAPPYIVGGGIVAEVSENDATWLDSPQRHEAGTPNAAGAVGLAAAIEYITSIGLEKIWQHEQQLTEYAFNKLKEVPELQLIGPPPTKLRAGIFSFQLTANGRPMHSHDIVTIANESGVALRGGHHCAQPLMRSFGMNDVTRASLGLYSTVADVDHLCESLLEVRAVFTRS